MRPGEPPAAVDAQDLITFVPREPKLRTQLRGAPRTALGRSGRFAKPAAAPGGGCVLRVPWRLH